MDIRQLSPRYSVSPQISTQDIPAIAEAGIKRIICNRPDAEVPPSHQAEAIGRAARDAGVGFEVLELTHQTMTPENIARQKSLIDEADGPVLAYCASGTRCSVVWALGQAGALSADEILAKTRDAGYDLEALRPQLESLAKPSD
ncbi:TIGR01244 family protein [Cribrihabitans marinus]|uniref:TIGR01244 family protein n=1 Tax=Cribrihabitans marinus TaxID=1227549 RepID=A0A1H6TBS3_9RHOB|nr:TIGR01244 family sulfur transferase [Cribrihabitans marinus]GGH22577.1 TIGR01244 family protein [Cribrihabitans marinus]SEI73262.1 TIGR01244 family protein [Cribrihabitans marinus]